jgi:hypothetical protein
MPPISGQNTTDHWGKDGGLLVNWWRKVAMATTVTYWLHSEAVRNSSEAFPEMLCPIISRGKSGEGNIQKPNQQYQSTKESEQNTWCLHHYLCW